MATDIPGLTRVTRNLSKRWTAWGTQIQQLSTTLPFAVWRLWLDGPVNPERPGFVGTTGFGVLDNISVYERFHEDGKAWNADHGGSLLELHAYAVPAAKTEETVRRELLEGLHAAYPETRGLKILEERFLLHEDCPAFPPRSNASRPRVTTPIEGLVLAGDFIKLDFPTALMERAVSSGFLAANTLLRRWSLPEEPIERVKPTGFLAKWPLERAPAQPVQAPEPAALQTAT